MFNYIYFKKTEWGCVVIVSYRMIVGPIYYAYSTAGCKSGSYTLKAGLGNMGGFQNIPKINFDTVLFKEVCFQ